MTRLVVNGRAVEVAVPARTHLADVLREHLLLTGTHIGCEHGVCGACTVLLDGEPARACIAWPALLEGASVCTIEGLEDDAVAGRLREAFSAEHALQCGYCTPGMMVTAWDIVHRLPDADDDRVRLELAGNLCRCTGYDGIVRAIRRVLDERLVLPGRVVVPVAGAVFGAVTVAAEGVRAVNQDGLHQRLRFEVGAEDLWAALQDPALIAGCIPGATLTSVEGGRVTGQMLVALGPVRVRFGGEATLSYDQGTRSGRVDGGGSDPLSGTRVTGGAAFRVEAEGGGSVLVVDVEYGVRGPLSQLAKGRVVDLVAGEIAGAFGRALGARLRGEVASGVGSISGVRVLVLAVRGWVLGVLGR